MEIQVVVIAFAGGAITGAVTTWIILTMVRRRDGRTDDPRIVYRKRDRYAAFLQAADEYTREVTRQPWMRTNIDIDDQLLSQAMTATGLSTKRATVEEGLRLLVRMRKQVKALANLEGLGWEGDLDRMREGRRSDPL